MTDQSTPAKGRKLLPILDYLLKNYLADVTEPGGGSQARLGILLKELGEKQANRDDAIQYLRSLTPFQKHILEAGKLLFSVNEEVSVALENQDADQITKGYFRIARLLVSLKLWRHIDFPIEDMDKELRFTPEERAFLDTMHGLDLPLDAAPKLPDPIVTTRVENVDRRELWEKGQLIDEDYEEPLHKQIDKFIQEKFNLFRISNYSGTKKPLPPNQHVKPGKVEKEVPDIVYFYGPSQFLEEKFQQLRTGNYKALDIERKESGGYNEKRFKFKLEGEQLVESESGLISAAVKYMTPHTIWQKMVNDVNLMEQTLTMGAKKIDKDYFFNIFYHIQKPVGEGGRPPEEEQPGQFERFEPSETDDRFRHRDRVTPEKASELISHLAKCDQYIFGGHLDLDLYLDGIGIRKKPNVMMIEGEGLGCYDYINNLILLPTICPPKVTVLDQVVSAMADFRYSLWIDSPKEIFEKQGVGFAIIGRKSKASSKKPLWQIFPTHASSLIKQRAFREYYAKHIISFLFSEGIRELCCCEIPITNKIADRKLRQFFDAYIPLAKFDAPPPGEKDEPAAKAAAPAKPEKEEAAPEPEKPAAARQEKPAAPVPGPEPEHPAPEPKKTAKPAAAPAAATPAAAAGSECPQCGKELPAGSKFCLDCGTKVELELKCIKCGVVLPPGSKFCNICGAHQ